MSNQENQDEKLEDIRRWVRALAFDKIMPKLEELESEEKKVYKLSTEDRSSRDIANKSSLGKTKIQKLKKSWFRQGLMKKVSVKGVGDRYVRLDSLENFGINVDIEENIDE